VKGKEKNHKNEKKQEWGNRHLFGGESKLGKVNAYGIPVETTR